MAYRKVLLAVDFAADNDEIVEKAVAAAKQNSAELLVIHVNEPMSSSCGAAPIGGWSPQIVELDIEARKQAEERLTALSDELNVDSNHRFMCEGRPAIEIKRLAEEQSVDLVVLGTHGKHGLGLLLGSTANGVLHGVSCDVLAVRVAG